LRNIFSKTKKFAEKNETLRRDFMKTLIVTVEDDKTISELVEFNLKNEGYDVKNFRSGREMFNERDSFTDVSLFILDIMLPDMDGFEICVKLRKIPAFESIPIIMLTAMGSEKDKVKALDSGADDYITKPFGVREFIARVNANIRRYIKSQGLIEESDLPGILEKEKNARLISIAGIELDDEKHRVFKSGKEIEMTNREYELLKFMMKNKGIAYTRDDLLSYVWGYEYAGETRTVDVHIRQLRRKLEDDDSDPRIIETVRGRGYRFTER